MRGQESQSFPRRNTRALLQQVEFEQDARIRPVEGKGLFHGLQGFRGLLLFAEIDEGQIAMYGWEGPVGTLRTLPESRGFGHLAIVVRSEEHTSELQSLRHLVCRLL